jgi:hypothetical protein
MAPHPRAELGSRCARACGALYRAEAHRTGGSRPPGRRGPSEAALGPTLAAIDGFYRYAADVGDVGREVLPVLFEVRRMNGAGAFASW